ncbi:MAG: hypothetical protein KC591_03095, partial [Gemmatimonadetes bacterium]|nr:hypothetical protein [Gemmatimonadota bacterium]
MMAGTTVKKTGGTKASRGNGRRKAGRAVFAPRVILPGALGAPATADVDEIGPQAVPGSIDGPIDGPTDEERNRIVRERTRATERYGADWVAAVETLAVRLRNAGVPARVASPQLADSAWLRSLGWAGQDHESLRWRGGTLSWVLRVAPGAGEWVREVVDGAPGLSRGGVPTLVVEESALAFLPVVEGTGRWPSAEAWRHAARVVTPGRGPGKGTSCSGLSAGAPASLEDLVQKLATPSAPGRANPAGDHVAMRARDLYEAARAWASNPAAFWLVERAALELPESEAAARAVNRGLPVRRACVERSGLMARVESSGIRLGLLDRAPRDRGLVVGARSVAAAVAVVEERASTGGFADSADFLRRLRRRGVAWRDLAAFALSGALRAL